MPVDFGKSAEDYAVYRPPFDPRLFERLRDHGIGLPHQRLLDVAAGTGLLGQGLVNSGCRIIECDPSHDLLRHAQSHHRVVARAENLPFPDDRFDAVTAGQCWHWFDRRIAPREIRRVLKPAGRIAIVYQTYLPFEGNIAAASEALILRYHPQWRHAGGVGINGQALKDLQTAGFASIESFSFDINVRYTRGAWRGFIRTCSAVGPTLPPERLERFDHDHATLLSRWPDTFDVPHRVFAAIATNPTARIIPPDS